MTESETPCEEATRLPNPESARQDFLLHVYDQAHANINRQFGFVWQSAGLVAAAFAVFAFAQEQHVSVDAPTSLFMIVAGWYGAHILDANLWFNRNLLIIANIERAFLRRSDVHDVHYFFAGHRKHNKLVGHLAIQLVFVLALAIAVWAYRCSERSVVTTTDRLLSPDLWAALAGISVAAVWFHTWRRYEKLRSTSPGPDLRND